MATIFVDGQKYNVDEEKNLLHVLLSAGLDVPYFCWHPALGSAGACRQCAVKQYRDEHDAHGRIVMACMTPASEGTRISIEDTQAKAFRAGIIELLMTNHPHDCPVCEEGGECHLQDMTEMTGHTFRTYSHKKRTHRNQYLGPFINHEMNRCIACYRCVRFYQDYAGGDDLQMFGAHHHVYFGRHTDGAFENPFSGNLVEVCPTGVFTDKTFSRHYTRKWDLQTAPSICQHCAVGCNTTPAERYGEIKRVTNRYNHEINGYFLCDRGRFGYEFLNSQKRILSVYRREEKPESLQINEANSATAHEAVARLKAVLKNDPTSIAIGSPRTSLENNFALLSAAGRARFCMGNHPVEDVLLEKIVRLYQTSFIHPPSLLTMESCDAVLILGEDIYNTAPLIALRVRQAVRNRSQTLAAAAGIPAWNDAAVQELAQQEKNPLIILSACSTAMDTLASLSMQRAPVDIARLGFAIAHAIYHEAPAVESLTTEDTQWVNRVADILKQARKPLVITGTSLLTPEIIDATQNIARALADSHSEKHRTDNSADKPDTTQSDSNEQPEILLHCCVAESNTLGGALLANGTDKALINLDTVLSDIEAGKIKRAVVLENDLFSRLPVSRLERALEKLDELIVLDSVWTETAAKADWIIPTASFTESEGTLVNSEGRAQRFFSVQPHSETVYPAWQWLHQADCHPWSEIDELIKACTNISPWLKHIDKAAMSADFRRQGQKIPRMSHRYSGRTAINAHINVSEPQQPEDSMSAFGYTMEGNRSHLPSSMQPATWAPGWNSNQSIHKFQHEVNGPLSGGPCGIRLFDSPNAVTMPTKNDWSKNIPLPFNPDEKYIYPVPLYHIFGSEELSRLSPSIAERLPRDYIALNPADAQTLGVNQGDGVNFFVDDYEYCTAVCIEPNLTQGMAGLPAGIGGVTLATFNQSLRLQRAFDWRPPPSADDSNVFFRSTSSDALTRDKGDSE